MGLLARRLPVVRDVVVVAVLAVVTFQALRRWCGDRYLVPTGSMEPVLHGDPRHGDVVFVDKLASAAGRRRNDLVVVHHPTEPGQQLVKRIAARGDDLPGGCWIDIRQGDVWIGESRTVDTRDVKDPLDSRGLRVPWADAPGTAASDGFVSFGAAHAASPRGPWSLPALDPSLADVRRTFADDVRKARTHAHGRRAIPDGFAGTAKPVDAGFLQATGARSRIGGDVLVGDVGLRVDCSRIAGDVLACVETQFEALTFRWQPATGLVELWRNGEDVAGAAVTLPPSPSPRRFEFGLLDNCAWFCVDGARERLFVVPRRSDWKERGYGTGTLAYVGVRAANGTAALDVEALHVFRDVYAYKDSNLGVSDEPGSWPRFVPAGHWFLLGDSCFDSRDSRHFGPVPASSFLGVPRLVLGPWARCRWVAP